MPTLTADDIPGLIESKEFNDLPFEKRQSIAEDALAEGAASLAGSWNRDTYQKWGQFANVVRNTVSNSETMGEKAGYYAGVVGGAIKDAAATAGTLAMGLTPVLFDEQTYEPKLQIPGETLAPMAGANLAGLATNAAQAVLDDPKPLKDSLTTLKTGIDNGDFFDQPGGLPAWLDAQDSALRQHQASYYRETPDAEGSWHRENSLLGNPANAEALNSYLRTRSPQAWQQLESSILQTPGMARIQTEKAAISQDSTLAKALPPQGRPYIEEAGDPVELAGTALSLGAGKAAMAVGKSLARRAVDVAKGVGAEVLSEQVSASMDKSHVPWEERVQIAKESLAAALGLGAVGAVTSRLSNQSSQATPAPAAAQPASPVENPFAGPITAPPQPTEDGGTIVPPAPTQVPAFSDDPFKAPSQPAGGNVLVDFGIAKTPEAQQAANEAEQQRLRQLARLRNGDAMGQGRPTIPDSPLGGRDILDFVNENPLLIPRKGTAARANAENDWSETYDIPLYYRKFIASSDKGHNAADLAQMAFDENYIQAPTSDALMAKIAETIRARTTYKVEIRKQEKGLKAEETHVRNFEKDQANRAQADKSLIPTETLAPGDNLTIKGEAVTVRQMEHDEDGNVTSVTLEDGKRYGIIKIDTTNRTGIFVDEWQPKQRPEARASEDPFMKGGGLSTDAIAAEKARAVERGASIDGEEILAMPEDPEKTRQQPIQAVPAVVPIPQVTIEQHPGGMIPAFRQWLKNAAADITQRVRQATGMPTGINFDKLKTFKSGENPLHHFQAVAALPELYQNSVVAAVTEDLKRNSTLKYERRYAWAMFPDGVRRHVLITSRLYPHPQQAPGIYSLEALEVEVREAPPTYMDSAVRGTDTAFDQGAQPLLADQNMSAFLAGIKPEHRYSGPSITVQEQQDGTLDVSIPINDETLPMPGAFQQPAVRGPLPSTSSNTPITQQIQTWTGKLHTLHGIRRYLLQAVGMPSVGVGRFRGALGIYKVRPETIRLQAQNDIPVLSHEIGHAIHFRILSDNPAKAPDWGGMYDGELLAIGQATSLPSYTRDQVRKEGVAEFIRGWLIDPAGIRAKAPRFSAFFEQEIEARRPEVAEALRNARFMIQDYIAMPAWAKLQSQIVLDPEAEKAPATKREYFRWVYSKLINTLAPLEWTLKDIAEVAPQNAAQARDVAAWLENHRGGWASKARQSIFSDQLDLKGKVIGPGFKKILGELQPHDIDPFRRYLIARRAMELESRGIRSGFENASLPAHELAELKRRFEPTRQKLLKWQQGNRDLLVQAGILSSADAAKMDALNEDYVPFYRLYEKVHGVSFGPEGSKNAGGFVNLNSGIRKLKGSDLAIVDPLQSMMKNAYMFRKLAEQNHIAVKFFNLVRDVQGGGKWGEGIAPKMVPQVTKHEDVVQKLIEEGVIQQESDLPANADLTLKLWQASRRPDDRIGEVIVFNGGKPQHWQVRDKLLIDSLKYADADAVSLGEIPGFMVKLFTMSTRLQRWGATGGPWFAITNMARDAVVAGAQSQAGFVPFWDSVKGILSVLRKDGHYEAWKNAGGQYSGLVTGTEAFTTLLEEALPKDRSTRAMAVQLADPKTWRSGFSKALELVGVVGRITEEGTRVGEFRRAQEHGFDDIQSANFSKSVSVNFARAGAVGRILNMFIPFLNANIQSLDLTFRLHWDPKTRGQVVMRGLMYISAPSLAVWALGKDDDEIQALPDYRKNLFWNINLRPLATALGMPEASFILSIPKPFLLGAIYGTSLERALDQATGRDPNGARKAAKDILANTMDPLGTMVSFAGMKALVEAKTNYSFWRDQPVVPVRMKDLPPEYQYDLSTSQTAKLLGRATGQSPMIIDHLISGYLATGGKWMTAAVDWALIKTGAVDLPPAPRKGMMEQPILNRFAASPYAANGFVDRFYKASESMEGLLKVWNKQTDQMTTHEQKRWWEKHGSEILAYTRTVNASTGLTGAGLIRKQQAMMSEINQAMKEVQASRVLSPDVKRARLIELAKQRNTAAEAGFKNLFPADVRRSLY